MEMLPEVESDHSIVSKDDNNDESIQIRPRFYEGETVLNNNVCV